MVYLQIYDSVQCMINKACQLLPHSVAHCIGPGVRHIEQPALQQPPQSWAAALPDCKAHWRPLTSPQYLARNCVLLYSWSPRTLVTPLSQSSLRVHQARHTSCCELTCGSQERGWPHLHAGSTAVFLPAPGVCAPAQRCRNASRLSHMLISHAHACPAHVLRAPAHLPDCACSPPWPGKKALLAAWLRSPAPCAGAAMQIAWLLPPCFSQPCSVNLEHGQLCCLSDVGLRYRLCSVTCTKQASALCLSKAYAASGLLCSLLGSAVSKLGS